MNHSDGASVFVDDEIPVSVVDMDIPVTAIDEVLDDDQCSASECESTLLRSTQSITSQPCTPCEVIQNKNNNARLTEEQHRSPFPDIEKQLQPATLTVIDKPTIQSPTSKKPSRDTKFTDNMEQKAMFNSETKSKAETIELTSQKDTVLQKSQSFARPDVQSVQNERTSSTRVLPTQGKITQSSFSRFGMKTFTVIPPKPAVSQTKPAGSLVTGAIKIDEQGNMVTQRQISTGPEKDFNPSVDTTRADKTPLVKAKAFWSTTEKQEKSTTANPGPIVNNGDTDVFKPSTVTGSVNLSMKTPLEETHKEVIIVERKPISVVASKPSFSENPSSTAEKRDLSFLIPSRRTSSQYVASVIAKNNKNSSIPKTKIDTTQALLSNGGVQNPVNQLLNNEVKPANIHKPAITFKPTENSVPSFRPKCLQSYVAEKPTSSERISTLHGGDRTKSLDSQPLSNKIQPFTHVSAHIKSMESFSEEATSINNFPDTSSARQTPTDTTHPSLAKKPELHKSEIPSEPNQGNVFGPVKKFKPVIFKPVQQETSIHSSLMEAIQSGEGIERLRKVNYCVCIYIYNISQHEIDLPAF